MRRVRYYLGGALFWGAFLAVCVLLFWNAQRLARAAGGISLRYGEALEPRVVASALEYARDGRNNAAWSPTFWAVRQGVASANGREETVRMLRVCGDAELLATEPLLYGALPGPAGQGGCAVSSALAWQLWGALDVTGLELELDGERYTVRGVFESGEARAVTQEAVDSRTAEYANVELTAMETAPEGTEAALAFAGASGLGTPAHVVDGPALAGLACALCWLPLALCGACTLWRLARSARRLRPWQRQTLLFAALLFFAALLPVLLAMVPGAWVPTRWSDFGFWAALGKSAAARVDAWFALPPQHKDIAVKWLLLEQGALCLAGCLFALRRPPAPRNEKAVEA